MMKYGSVFKFFLVTLLISSYTSVLATPLMVQAQGAEQAILVYIDGDNDLEPATLKDLAKMKVYASTNSVNVDVLLDGSEKGYEYEYTSEFVNLECLDTQNEE